jgi:serine kinase of HPr protein (carbohydrate metabolism regulator)
MATLDVIIFVRNKRPTEDMIELAEENDMVLIASPYSMFKACGLLYEAGLKPLY